MSRVAGQQHEQPEERPDTAVLRHPGLLGRHEGEPVEQVIGIDAGVRPDRQVLDGVSDLVGEVADTGVLEVDDPDPGAVPDQVGGVAIRASEHRMLRLGELGGQRPDPDRARRPAPPGRRDRGSARSSREPSRSAQARISAIPTAGPHRRSGRSAELVRRDRLVQTGHRLDRGIQTGRCDRDVSPRAGRQGPGSSSRTAPCRPGRSRAGGDQVGLLGRGPAAVPATHGAARLGPTGNTSSSPWLQPKVRS